MLAWGLSSSESLQGFLVTFLAAGLTASFLVALGLSSSESLQGLSIFLAGFAAGFLAAVLPKVLGPSFFLAAGFFLGSESESPERKSVIFLGAAFLGAGFLAGGFFAGDALTGETESSENKK